MTMRATSASASRFSSRMSAMRTGLDTFQRVDSLSSLKTKLETRNSKIEIRNSKIETRIPKIEYRKSKIENQKSKLATTGRFYEGGNPSIPTLSDLTRTTTNFEFRFSNFDFRISISDPGT
jgi:hypothetical protein